ncbi:MAG: hypothetical protein IT174_10780 [Acidobacteria bacterium]|nr:hypothetical protein [Acidobacteriota bacterium]
MDHFEQLKRMTAAAAEPVLANDEIESLLAMFAVVDADGLKPTDPEWRPTYRLKAAAAEGWRWKAAKAAELISSDLDGDRMSAHQVFYHCQDMVKIYSRGTATTSMSGATN